MSVQLLEAPIAIGFPGQGPHDPERMNRLIRNFPIAAGLVQIGEDKLNKPLFYLLLDPINPNNTSQENQLRSYLGSAALYMVARAEGVIPPARKEYFFGASAGEVATMMADGRFDFLTGLVVIDSRGHEMHEASKLKSGKMLVASGLPFERAEEIARIIGDVEAVSDNPGIQSVFSGTEEAIEAVAQMLTEEWTDVKLLIPDIYEAAHNIRHMGPAVIGFMETLKRVRIKRGSGRVMGNQAELLDAFWRVRQTRKHLAAQLTRRVYLRQSVDKLYHERGVRTFVDVGQGKIIYGQLRRHFRSAREPVELISIVDELLPIDRKSRKK